MKCPENAVPVFDTLLTIQFFERSHVPVFLPTSQISHVNLTVRIADHCLLFPQLFHLFITNYPHIS